MKKFARFFVLVFSVVFGVGAAIAATIDMQAVNQKVAALVAPFNTADLEMKFEFTALDIDSVRTLDFGFIGFVSKIGATNEAKLDIKRAQYTYGDGTKPTFDVDARLDLDLIKAFGQDRINEFPDEADQMIVDFAGDFTREYGAAVDINAAVSNKIVDMNGNIESMTMTFSAVVDFAKLPATKPLDEVEFQSVDIVLSAGKTGVSATLKVVFNPQFSGFDEQGVGLKEYINGLLNDDPDVYDQMNMYLGQLADLASWLVELKP